MRLRGPKQERPPRESCEYQPGEYPGAAANPLSGNYWQPKKRGKINGFSRASRLRMLEKMAGLNLKKLDTLPLLITLTYPADFPEDWRTVKAHMVAFRKRLLRKWPKAAGVWKLERQQRGAPHVHLMLYNVAFLPHRWLAVAWHMIAAPKSPEHLRAGTQVQRCRSHRQAMCYAAKYLGKPSGGGDTESWGRRWGIWNARFLPLTLIVAPIGEAAAYTVRRWLWKYQRAHGYRRRGRRGRFDGTSAWIGSETMNRMIGLAVQEGRDG